jgi:anti-sigma-K factor RskA
MSGHEQFADDLSLYALGALEGEPRLALEKHLEECLDCRRELELLRGDAALLAFSVSGPQPPARSRDRLMNAIAKEPRRSTNVVVGKVRPAKRSFWWNAFEWAAAAAAVIIVVLLVRQNTDMQRQIAGLAANSTQQQKQLMQAKELLTSLTSPDALHFTLVAGKTTPQPQGKAIYVRGTGTLVFLANNMPQLPSQKIYELWLIPATGAPIPAGLFKPDAHGAATVVRPPLPAGVEAKTFAITVEPEAGSAAPTSKPVMVGVQS